MDALVAKNDSVAHEELFVELALTEYDELIDIDDVFAQLDVFEYDAVIETIDVFAQLDVPKLEPVKSATTYLFAATKKLAVKDAEA